MNNKKILEKLKDIENCNLPCVDCCYDCDLSVECEDEITDYGETCIIRNLQRLIKELEETV